MDTVENRSAPVLAQELIDECKGHVDIALLHIIDDRYGPNDLLDACAGFKPLAAMTLIQVAHGVWS